MLNPDGISQGNVFKRAPEAVESLPGQGSGCPQEDRLSWDMKHWSLERSGD